MDSGSTLPRRRLGWHIREARSALNMPLATLAKLSEVSPTTLQRLETGEGTRLKARDIQAICSVLEMSEETTAAMVGFLQQSAEKSWWHRYDGAIPAGFDVYVGLESGSERLVCYQSDIVLGLLQTRDYARTLTLAARPMESREEIDLRTQLKLKRQALITRKKRPAVLDVVLHESALRRVVGDAGVMAAQLRHLADISVLPNVTIRVMPFSGGVPLGDPVGSFAILDFGLDQTGKEVAPSVVYVEHWVGDFYLEKTQDLDAYHRARAAIWGSALDEIATRNLLRQLAKEYDRER